MKGARVASRSGAVAAERLEAYRSETFRTAAGLRVGSIQQAVAFVEQRGFIFFWPIRGVLLPSLWVAVAGDRPVAAEHDDPGHVTWGWKDSLLGERRWYYGKVLRKRATLISMQVAPCFYALSHNFGSPEEDYLDQYERGLLNREAKLIYEKLLREGPTDTVALRRATFMTTRSSNYRFGRALAELQADFKILPVGVARAGAWRYAFVYDLVHRHLPQLPERARRIGERDARRELLLLYLRSVGAAPLAQARKLFGWAPQDLEGALQDLVEGGRARRGLRGPAQGGEWCALPELVD